MTPVRFLLSVPIDGPGKRQEVCLVASPRLVRSDRLSAWSSNETDRIVFGGGAIFGRLFQHTDGLPLRTLPPVCPSTADSVTFAQWLTRSAWGGWLALLNDAKGGYFSIARDPSPLLPVYRLQDRSRILFATDPSLFAEVGAGLRVSWTDLRAHLLYPELRTVRTSLDGVEEVAPGRLVPLACGRQDSVRLWDPWTFAAAPWRIDREQAGTQLRAIGTACIAAWAQSSGRVAVAASGGVDSSFICAALAMSGHAFDCGSVATRDRSGDESAYVQQLASALGVRAAVRPYDPAAVDLTRPASAGLPRPTRKSFMPAFRQAMAAACGDLGADAVFDGNGGDNLFSFLHSSAPALDRLWQIGPGIGFGRTVLDLCRLTGCDLPTMLHTIAVRAVRPAHQPWRPDKRLLTAGLGDGTNPTPLTDWLSGCPPRRPGKRAHIALIMRTQNFLNELGGLHQPFVFSPLLSQPLLEFCLSVPSWEWCRGGTNRSLARDAFRAELPSSVTARVSKAGPDSFVRDIFARNRSVLRDLLLGGLLFDNGLLDTAAITVALSADEHGKDPIVYRLLDLAEAESWVRSWS